MTRADRRAAVAIARKNGTVWGPWVRREISDELRRRFPACAEVRAAVANERYVVQLYVVSSLWGPVEHLIVRRVDEQPIRSWTDMQRIKDELVGEDRTAVEVFPSKANVVDQANLYHLWVLPSGVELPFGLHLPGAGMRG